MKNKSNTLRIIGGRFRGRKILFPNIPEIRPTPDRIRETVFNWLQNTIIDSNCLDLFCGSGALGLEAISRGANKVMAFDKEKLIVDYLKTLALNLQLTNYSVQQSELPCELFLAKDAIDIIFLDPPFRQNLVPQCLNWIYQTEFLKPEGIIYLETERDFIFSDLSAQWQILKEKYAGQLCYRLLKKIDFKKCIRAKSTTDT